MLVRKRKCFLGDMEIASSVQLKVELNWEISKEQETIERFLPDFEASQRLQNQRKVGRGEEKPPLFSQTSENSTHPCLLSSSVFATFWLICFLFFRFDNTSADNRLQNSLQKHWRYEHFCLQYSGTAPVCAVQWYSTCVCCIAVQHLWVQYSGTAPVCAAQCTALVCAAQWYSTFVCSTVVQQFCLQYRVQHFCAVQWSSTFVCSTVVFHFCVKYSGTSLCMQYSGTALLCSTVVQHWFVHYSGTALVCAV
jgi:hypothetical protein